MCTINGMTFRAPLCMYLKVRRNLRPTVLLYNLHQSTFGFKQSYGMCGMQYCECWQRKQYSIQVCEYKYKSLLQYSNKKAGGSLSCLGRDKIIMLQCCKTFGQKTSVLQTGNISRNPQATGLNFTCHLIILTLRLPD